AVDRQHIDAEGRLHGRIAEELVQDDIRNRVLAQLDHHPQAMAVRLVADLADALDHLVADNLGDTLEHPGLVDLVGYLRDDNGLALARQTLDMSARAHQDRATAGPIGGGDPRPSENEPPGREIGT